MVLAQLIQLGNSFQQGLSLLEKLNYQQGRSSLHHSHQMELTNLPRHNICQLGIEYILHRSLPMHWDYRFRPGKELEKESLQDSMIRQDTQKG